MLVVDPRDWLQEDGRLPTDNLRLRRLVLRIARFIEYGGTLKPGESRETLVECRRRPKGAACLGLMWVQKTRDNAIFAFCCACGDDEAFVHNWQATEWATGMMEPVPGPPLGPDDEEPTAPGLASPFRRN
jgi:hypothetical protein